MGPSNGWASSDQREEGERGGEGALGEEGEREREGVREREKCEVRAASPRDPSRAQLSITLAAGSSRCRKKQDLLSFVFVNTELPLKRQQANYMLYQKRLQDGPPSLNWRHEF